MNGDIQSPAPDVLPGALGERPYAVLLVVVDREHPLRALARVPRLAQGALADLQVGDPVRLRGPLAVGVAFRVAEFGPRGATRRVVLEHSARQSLQRGHVCRIPSRLQQHDSPMRTLHPRASSRK